MHYTYPTLMTSHLVANCRQPDSAPSISIIRSGKKNINMITLMRTGIDISFNSIHSCHFWRRAGDCSLLTLDLRIQKFVVFDWNSLSTTQLYRSSFFFISLHFVIIEMEYLTGEKKKSEICIKVVKLFQNSSHIFDSYRTFAALFWLAFISSKL